MSKFKIGDTVQDINNNHILEVGKVQRSCGWFWEYYLLTSGSDGGYWASEEDLRVANPSKKDSLHTSKFLEGVGSALKSRSRGIAIDSVCGGEDKYSKFGKGDEVLHKDCSAKVQNCDYCEERGTFTYFIRYKDGFDTWVDEAELSKGSSAITSDGSDGKYYDRSIPKYILDKWNETGVVSAEDLIYVIFRNDFNFGNSFKSLVRADSFVRGIGKQGNTLKYECNKVHYYTDKIEEQASKQ
jgi:hypothetical protein